MIFFTKSRIIKSLVFMIFCVVSINAQEKSSEADEAAIRQIIKQVEAGWNANSGKEFAAPFAENADYVVVNGMHVKGREAIDKGHQQIFDTIYKGSRNAGTIKQIRFLRPDVAVVHVEWNLNFKANGEERKGKAFNTMVMTKENGKWSIAAFQNTGIEGGR